MVYVNTLVVSGSLALHVPEAVCDDATRLIDRYGSIKE